MAAHGNGGAAVFNYLSSLSKRKAGTKDQLEYLRPGTMLAQQLVIAVAAHTGAVPAQLILLSRYKQLAITTYYYRWHCC
jgi:hypothetical protein